MHFRKITIDFYKGVGYDPWANDVNRSTFESDAKIVPMQLSHGP